MFQYVDHYEVVLRQSPFFIDPKIPLDVMGFFSNDEIFLKIDQNTGKLERFQSIEADYNAHLLGHLLGNLSYELLMCSW